jgi:hypothetical protein
MFLFDGQGPVLAKLKKQSRAQPFFLGILEADQPPLSDRPIYGPNFTFNSGDKLIETEV